MVDATSVEFIRALTPESAAQLRWAFSLDMNHDGHITITDLGMLWSWVFYAPGDFLFLVAMLKLPSVAAFLEMTPKLLYGWWSLFVSLIVWCSAIKLYR
jgi:hypothetical protein